MTKKQHDMRGNEINDPYNVITSRVKLKIQELAGHLGSLNDPEKLLEAYATGRDLATLGSVLFKIYEPSLKEIDLPGGLNQIKKIKKDNERYQSKLVEMLSQNQEVRDKEMLAILERNKNESYGMLMNAFSNFTKRRRFGNRGRFRISYNR